MAQHAEPVGAFLPPFSPRQHRRVLNQLVEVVDREAQPAVVLGQEV
jgi:hypothetical protein